MRVVFMGTPEFAATILREVAEQHDVICVYSQPDKVRGRGKKLVPSPVKVIAEGLGIDVRTPKSLRDDKEIDFLESLNPDVICVAAYGMLLPRAVLEIPEHGCLNVHASILPRWRGAAPIEHAILSGDELAGVCIMRMEEGLDTGDWCVCRKIPIAGMRASDVTAELANLGAQALITALSQVQSGSVAWMQQDESLATYASKLDKRELWLDPEGEAQAEYLKFLASSGSHTCKADVSGKVCTIEEASLLSLGNAGMCGAAFEPGSVSVDEGRLFLGFADGAIEVLALKPDGKSSMPAKAFLAGAHLNDGSRWNKA